MKYTSKSILLYKIPFTNNYTKFWSTSYNKNIYNYYIITIIDLQKFLYYLLESNCMYDNNFYIKNNIINLNSKLSIDNNITKIYNIKLLLNTLLNIIKTKIQKFKKIFLNFNFYITISILKSNKLSIQYIVKFIKQSLKYNIPIRKLFNIISNKLFYFNSFKNIITGIKIIISGRLNNTDKAFSEKFILGKLRLQTIKFPLSYINTNYKTKYGILGIKIWLAYSLQ